MRKYGWWIGSLCAVAVIGLLCFFIIGSWYTRVSRRPQLTDRARFEIQIRDRIAKGVSEARELANKGKHMEAARLLISLAGAEGALLRMGNTEGGDGSPTTIERMALMELTLVGERQVYRDLLVVLYPEWNAGGK